MDTRMHRAILDKHPRQNVTTSEKDFHSTEVDALEILHMICPFCPHFSDPACRHFPSLFAVLDPGWPEGLPFCSRRCDLGWPEISLFRSRSYSPWMVPTACTAAPQPLGGGGGEGVTLFTCRKAWRECAEQPRGDDKAWQQAA
eukprot:TRINITY_DN585_c0_g3_i2.p1 TRINITY_DN585_c0_g3~~TRINITY_DN585_c0_g3_i2.p1  ORF type:complete len:143 (+),score=5.95 TRINITY_DN585_c0_g3_i2:2389-2817(+)